MHQFSEMAFVAGLLVVPAILVVLLVHGVASYLLRRDKESVASQMVRAGTPTRFAAALITLVAGYLAFHSFSARPDAYAAFAVLGLTAANLYYLARSRA
jgi:surface polysaccharide O-acyltransferase-like enzyme